MYNKRKCLKKMYKCMRNNSASLRVKKLEIAKKKDRNFVLLSTFAINSFSWLIKSRKNLFYISEALKKKTKKKRHFKLKLWVFNFW